MRDTRGAVLGSVVYDHDLQRPVVLGEDALDRGREIPLGVASRDDDADPRSTVHRLARRSAIAGGAVRGSGPTSRKNAGTRRNSSASGLNPAPSFEGS